jgi:hypothetical protein
MEDLSNVSGFKNMLVICHYDGHIPNPMANPERLLSHLLHNADESYQVVQSIRYCRSGETWRDLLSNP